MHAAGFAAWKDGEMVVKKCFNIRELNFELSRLWPFNAMVGHTRYSTSGDWQDHRENQPIEFDGVAFAFNGVISGATREENEERFEMKLETSNDAEIFLNKYIFRNDLNELMRVTKASFAGLVLDEDDLKPFRNSRRPLYSIQESHGTFYASTADIFKRAKFTGNPTEVPCNLD